MALCCCRSSAAAGLLPALCVYVQVAVMVAGLLSEPKPSDESPSRDETAEIASIAAEDTSRIASNTGCSARAESARIHNMRAEANNTTKSTANSSASDEFCH